MTGTLRFSEAFMLGLHAACYLAGRDGGKASTREIALYLGVSEAHLAKVMQRLARSGLLRSYRGPGGGFRLGREGREISLMDIYECLEGPFSPTTCFLGRESCLGKSCVLEGLIGSVDSRFESYLRGTDLDKAGALLSPHGKTTPSGRRSSPATRGRAHGGKAARIEGTTESLSRGRAAKTGDADAGKGGREGMNKE